VQYEWSRPERRLSLSRGRAARIEPAMANTAAARW
jgi:hypothetical protein